MLVLDQGRVAEFEAPGVLLADRASRFYSMALEAGLVQDVDDGRVRADGGEGNGPDEAQEEAQEEN